MSDVYEAIDEQSGDPVAVKIVRSGDPEFVRRLTLEARALESFEHPGLITLLDTGLTGDDAYLVMEFVDGPTLSTSLQSGPLGAPQTASLGARLADALAYVHERGIVHRDVKPSNILQSAQGEAWLGDFGIAQLHDATTLTAMGTAMGTVVYMAPEQLEGERVGPSADIWSLGIVLLECLTGRRAYEGSPSEIVARRMAGPVALPEALPAPWKLVLSGMLDYRPEQRLDGRQVAALLSSSAYAAPWQPSSADVTERLTPVGPNDLTVLMPGAVKPAAVAGDETLVTPPARNAVAPLARPKWFVPGLLIALAALVIVLIFWLSSLPSSVPPTTTTESTTTTTSVSSSTLIANLLNDLATGQAAGNVDPGSVQSITQDAERALFDQTSGNSVAAENDLQQAATVIANGTQSGQISQREGTLLESDLSKLARSLGVSAPSVTTTTTPTGPTPPGNSGNGHGKGPGH